MTVRNVLRIHHQRGPRSVSAPSSQAASRRPAWALADPDDSITYRFHPAEKETEALRESDGRFRATFEHATVGIDHPGGRWLCVNQRLCDILGFTREELPALTFQDITFAADLPLDLERMEQRYAARSQRTRWRSATCANRASCCSGAPDRVTRAQPGRNSQSISSASSRTSRRVSRPK